MKLTRRRYRGAHRSERPGPYPCTYRPAADPWAGHPYAYPSQVPVLYTVLANSKATTK